MTSSRQPAAVLIAMLDPIVPPAWKRFATRASWGSIVWAGDQVAVSGDWLVLGVPSVDPWGWPGRRMEPEEMAGRLTLFGPSAVRTASGPFLVVDMRTGTVTCPANGIVPFWIGQDLSSTCQGLADVGSRETPPLPHSGFERTARTVLDGRRVRAELLEHRPSGVDDADALVPGVFDPLWRRGVDAASRLRSLRREAGRRWWSGRLHDRWVHAPALERPVVDRLLEAGS